MKKQNIMHKNNPVMLNKPSVMLNKTSVMLNLFQHLLITILGGAFLCIAFTSCENFLKGAETRKQLADAIAYANASAHEIRVEIEPDSGTLVTQNILSKKVSDEFEIEFKLSKGWLLHNWQAFTRAQDGTLSQLSDEYISFSNNTHNPDNDVYKIKAKFKKETASIVIKPVCYLLPSVISYTPSNVSELNYANTPIKITFNMSMDTELFKKEYLSITYEGKHYEGFFEEPYFNENKTVLTLQPKIKEFYNELVLNNSAFTEIKIVLSPDITLVKDGITLPFLPNEKSSFYVRYKADKEEDPPSQYSFFVTRCNILDGDYNANTLNDENKMILKSVDKMSDSEILQNRTNGIIYIYGRFFDDGSGVKSVDVSEQKTNEPDGNVSGAELFTTKEPYKKNSNETIFIDEGNGYTTFVIKHNLQSEDGAVRINVKVLDAVGNIKEVDPFSVIKKSKILTDNFDFMNSTDFFSKYYTESIFDEEDFNTFIKTFNFSCNGDVTKWNERVEHLYGDDSSKIIRLPSSSFTVACEYTEKDKSTVKGDFEDISAPDESDYFEFKKFFDVESISNLKVKIFIDDDMGNSAVMEYIVPDPQEVIPVVKKDGVLAQYSFYSPTGSQISQGLKFYNDKLQSFICYYEPSSGNFNPFNIGPNDSYNFSFYIGKFLTEKTQTTFTNAVDNSNLPGLTMGNPKYSLSKSESHEFNLNYLDINLDVQNKNAYDDILVKVRTQDSPGNLEDSLWSGKTRTYVCDVNGNLLVPVQTEFFYGGSVNVTVQGVKDLSVTNGVSFNIPKIDNDIQYDNLIPAIKYDHAYDKITISGIDLQTGIKQITATVIETGKKYTSTTGTLQVPAWDNRSNHLKIEVEDNAENLDYKTIFFSSYSTIDFVEVEKQNSSYMLISNEYPNLSPNWVTSEVYYLKPDGSWELYNTIPSDTYIQLEETQSGNKIGKRLLNATGASPDVPQDSYIRVLSKIYYYGMPLYFYTGNGSSGSYDYILPKTKERVLVASDAPAFVHTLVTTAPYDECKNWDASKWENMHEALESVYLNFSASKNSPQSYYIPISQINEGYCYCVIAHFANGNIDMSDVMVME